MIEPDMSLKNRILKFLQRKAKCIQLPLIEALNTLRFESLDRLDYAQRQLETQSRFIKDATVSLLFSRWLTHPDALASRNEVGYWLNWLGLTGEGVEVGVLRGEFSLQILSTWEGSRLTSIDPWREFPSTEYLDVANVSQEIQQQNFEATLSRLRSFGERSRILKTTSAQAATEFPDGSLEFVYLDAQHHYEAIRDDIRIWHPKVKAGGVLGGHDYLNGTVSSSDFGVARAVDEFAAANSLKIITTKEPIFKSWFLIVP